MGTMKDWMDRPYQVREDEFDEVSALQDVDDPVWPSSPVEPDVQTVRVPDQGDGGLVVRTATGVLDFVEGLAEEVFDIPSDKETQAKRDRRPPQPVVDVVARGATSWRAESFNIASNGGGGILIASERNDRIRCVVYNWGPGIAYLSHARAAGINGNVVQIPLNNSREFRTANAIYAFPAVVGTAQVVDVQDEYGLPE